MLEKIKALLAKADPANGATDEEAKTFMEKAQELMTKYGIEEMDLAALEGEKPAWDMGRENVDLEHVRRNTDLHVARVVKQAFDVEIIHSMTANGKQRYILLGDEVDRIIARFAIPLLYDAMFYGYKKWVRDNDRSWKVGEERSYCQGVADGYLNASEEGKAAVLKTLSKKKQETFGLILVDKRHALAEYTKEQFPKLVNIRTRASQGSDDAYSNGHAKGSKLKLKPGNNLKGSAAAKMLD